jgi:hypothetical protein
MEAFLEMGNRWSESDALALGEVADRLVAEQADERDPACPQLDQQTLAQWLGRLPADVAAFMDRWAQIHLGGDATDVSLCAAVVAWGRFKTVAFTRPEDVPQHDLGSSLSQMGAPVCSMG